MDVGVLSRSVIVLSNFLQQRNDRSSGQGQGFVDFDIDTQDRLGIARKNAVIVVANLHRIKVHKINPLPSQRHARESDIQKGFDFCGFRVAPGFRRGCRNNARII